jgi:hypothetical protein
MLVCFGVVKNHFRLSFSSGDDTQQEVIEATASQVYWWWRDDILLYYDDINHFNDSVPSPIDLIVTIHVKLHHQNSIIIIRIINDTINIIWIINVTIDVMIVIITVQTTINKHIVSMDNNEISLPRVHLTLDGVWLSPLFQVDSDFSFFDYNIIQSKHQSTWKRVASSQT